MYIELYIVLPESIQLNVIHVLYMCSLVKQYMYMYMYMYIHLCLQYTYSVH